MESFNLKLFDKKKVIVTGNTGFKGSWLCQWLIMLNAKVVGISNNIPTNPSHFELLNHKKKIKHYNCDIRNKDKLLKIFRNEKPDFIFHLAAQSLVKDSVNEPFDTFSTNSLGTVTILEVLRILNHKVSCVIITSDKVYKNVEWLWGYKENDIIGGDDPYSASKGMAELALNSYLKTFFTEKKNKIRLAIARAGNVIGGGDWSSNRLIPDTVKSWSSKKNVIIRNPNSTRPWQHVLDPIYGYMKLALNLSKNNELHGEAFNFGPNFDQDVNVIDLIKLFSKNWEAAKWTIKLDTFKVKEANLLKLNCEKSFKVLSWSPAFDFETTIKLTSEWYKEFYFGHKKNIIEITKNQIISYMGLIKSDI